MAERIRFYFDQHIPSAVARGLNRRGVDVLTACSASKYSIGELIYVLLLVQDSLTPDEMRNHVEFL